MTEREVSSERVSGERLGQIATDKDNFYRPEIKAMAQELLALRSSVKTVGVKKLEWEAIDGGNAFRAPALIFGWIRIETYTLHRWQVQWSVPGICNILLPSVFDTPDEAKAAAQADYERRILSAIEAPAAEGEQIDKTLLHGICDSLRAVIMEYEDMNMFPGSRAIMQSQLDALTAALKGDRS